MKNILLCFGGNSSEHEISLISAQNIINNIDENKYNIFKVYLSLNCQWKYVKDKKIGNVSKTYESLDNVVLFNDGNAVFLYNLEKKHSIAQIDFAFPILHGKNGEDGAIQGLFNMLNLPYAGSSISGACLSMDKEISKILVNNINIPIVDYLVWMTHDKAYPYDYIIAQLGLPFIMKPCNSGSSIGVYKICCEDDYEKALVEIAKLDSKVLIEEFLEIREIECGVIGNDVPQSSPVIGEVTSNDEFYSYSAKYDHTLNTNIFIPASVSNEIKQIIQEYSVRIYKRLQCLGFARVDFFLTKDNVVIFNELNAIPGFTDMSMFPLLWSEKFNNTTELITMLIEVGEQLKK